MKTMLLGKTGLRVSRLCFGTAGLGSLGEKLSLDHGADLLAEAWNLGIVFWDTADDYGTHAYVARALKRVPRERVVILTKTVAEDGLDASLSRCLKELKTDYIDLLLVHCLMPNWFEPGVELLREMIRVKASGRIRAVGLSTHSVDVARRAVTMPEVEVVMALLNVDGRFKSKDYEIEDGTMPQMHDACRMVFGAGKGVVAMKVLGGGAHVDNPEPAIRFVAGLPYVHALCVGMESIAQVKENLRIVEESRRAGASGGVPLSSSHSSPPRTRRRGAALGKGR
jgi:aryl-alcohol dehydrogenase-like predicted oxidoreductase